MDSAFLYYYYRQLLCCGCCCYRGDRHDYDDDDDSDGDGDTTPGNEAQYERIVIDTEDERSATDWSLDLLNTPSSESSHDSSDDDDDGKQPLTVETIMDDENSVDDTEYYRLYIPRAHKQPVNQREHRKKRSIALTSACIANARNKATACLDATTRADYEEILFAYEEALGHCPDRHKPHLVREYETFKVVYSTFSSTSSEYRKAERVARDAWKQASLADHTITRRQCYFRRAIMCMPNIQIKNQWKKEYNLFYNATLL